MESKNKKLVCGIGLNDADYAVTKHETIEVNGVRKQKLVWMCLYYQAWKNMLMRCYSARWQERYPTYAGCTVAEDWLTFSVFRNWMRKQDWKGNQLDKDLLFEGNKVYGAGTCVFVTQAVNKFTIDSGASRGEWLIGAYWEKDRKKFRARCRNPFSGKQEYLGYFDSEQEAHNAWQARKLELAHLLAAEQTDTRVAKALIKRYSKPQEQ